MKRLALFAALAVCALPVSAERKAPDINTETPAGALLQKIGQENDEKAKLGLMEQFISQFAKHDSADWVYVQLSFAGGTGAGRPSAASDSSDD